MDSRIANRWYGLLPALPTSVRLGLSAFLAVIGFGYLIAVANIYHRHALADGKAGLGLNDIRAVYGGLIGGASSDVASRMLTMIRTSMREYIADESDFPVLESWLKRGGNSEELDLGEGRATPRRILVRNCMRCHAVSSGTEIGKNSPFGEDEFDVDPLRLTAFTSPRPTTSSEPGGMPPQYNLPRLILVSHMHMLSIPLFTLVVAILFGLTRLPAKIRHFLLPIPMLALVIDFGGWWLARVSSTGALLVIVGGGVFGVALGVQIIAAAVDLWWPCAQRSADGDYGGSQV